MTGAQFDALPYEEGRRWELIEGELIPVSSPTPKHQLVLQRLLRRLLDYMDAHHGTGLVLTDVEFALDDEHRVRPDILVLLGARAESLDLDKVPVPGAPDLAVEIISPTERSADSQQKVQAYLRHGTQEVWQVYPKSKSVMVHRAGASETREAGQPLTSGLLPGFQMAVEALF
jgi:Uma2 family endonuclease